jgi:hypothetical protein
VALPIAFPSLMEYTTDPEAIAHYLAARSRTANWVDSLTGKTLMGIGSEIEAAEASLQPIISHQYHYQTPTYTPQQPGVYYHPLPRASTYNGRPTRQGTLFPF